MTVRTLSCCWQFFLVWISGRLEVPARNSCLLDFNAHVTVHWLTVLPKWEQRYSSVPQAYWETYLSSVHVPFLPNTLLSFYSEIRSEYCTWQWIVMNCTCHSAQPVALHTLHPCFTDLCRYIISVQGPSNDWSETRHTDVKAHVHCLSYVGIPEL